jgi:hypothetical protein
MHSSLVVLPLLLLLLVVVVAGLTVSESQLAAARKAKGRSFSN